ncbi:lipoic acid synthetase/lipoyl(octanoyl) transferase [Desulfocicer vacuolatum DSM 3385]|uniref:Octanoyltransferase n=1 Tax=Desulfocicer vacuolatum DSM 3385 TaxID=1121400 RepID=A0A1W2D5D8_9BACT|nr:lipoyl(octanoyl) transferase LipB [Desulfocicer vacuolatum]SMC92740.1 lipoic acid synthetase/lipoyl(octanoyl) transferase [Desulfocicer vacuolatum DSM 3385]
MSRNRSCSLDIRDLGMTAYAEAFKYQKELAAGRAAEKSGDCLILTEHFPTVTLGRSGSTADLCLPESELKMRGIDTVYVDRGGKATYHGPGQLVAYPIVKLKNQDLHAYLEKLLGSVKATLGVFGIDSEKQTGKPGLYVGDAKIMSVGIAVSQWVTYHGIALNVNNDPSSFNCIVPCGHPNQKMISMANILGHPLDIEQVKLEFIRQFSCRFEYFCDHNSERQAAR